MSNLTTLKARYLGTRSDIGYHKGDVHKLKIQINDIGWVRIYSESMISDNYSVESLEAFMKEWELVCRR